MLDSQFPGDTKAINVKFYNTFRFLCTFTHETSFVIIFIYMYIPSEIILSETFSNISNDKDFIHYSTYLIFIKGQH